MQILIIKYEKPKTHLHLFFVLFFGRGGGDLFDKTIIIHKDGCYCQTWTP